MNYSASGNSSTVFKSSGSGSIASSLNKTKVHSFNYCNDHQQLRDHYDITGFKHNLFCFEHVSSTDIQLKPSNFKKIWPELFEFYIIKSFKFQNLYGPVFNVESNDKEQRQISLYVISSDSLDGEKRKNLEEIRMNKTYFQNKNGKFLEIYEVKTIKVEENSVVKTLHLIEYEHFMCLKRFLQKKEYERNEKMDIFAQIFEEVASLHSNNIYNIELGLENIAIISVSEAKFYPKISCINGLINDSNKIPQNKQNDLAELGKLLYMMMSDKEDEKMCLDKRLPEIINKIINSLCSGDKKNKVIQINEMFELLDEEKQSRTTVIKLNKK